MFALFVLTNQDTLINIIPLNPQEIAERKNISSGQPLSVSAASGNTVLVSYPQFCCSVDVLTGGVDFVFAGIGQQTRGAIVLISKQLQ